jgi:hypothetical protein
MNVDQARESARASYIEFLEHGPDKEGVHQWAHDELDAIYGLHLAGRSGMTDAAYAAYCGEIELVRIQLAREEEV